MQIKACQHILHAKKTPYWLMALGILLVSPSLFSGFFADDYNFYALTYKQLVPKYPFSLWDYFTFLTDSERTHLYQNQGILPWWLDETMQAVFFRPLSEISHFIDFMYLKQPILMHLHSLFWYGILLYVYHRLLTNFGLKPLLINLSLLLFVIDSTHGFTVAWLANRNAIIACVFVLLAVNFFHHYVNRDRLKDQCLYLLMILLGLLSAELAIAVAPLLLVYLLGFHTYKLKTLVFYLWPPALLILVWLIAYQMGGFGAYSENGYYIDPFSSPAHFLKTALARLPQAIAMQWNILPLHYVGIGEQRLVAIGLALLFLISIWVWCLVKRQQPLAKYGIFFGSASLLSLVPVLAAEMQERNLLLFGLLSSPLMAILMIEIYRWSPVSRLNRFVRFSGLSYFALGHIVFAICLMPIVSYAPQLMGERLTQLVQAFPKQHQNQLFVVGLNLMEAPYLQPALFIEKKAEIPQTINLSARSKDVTVKRLSPYSLIVEHPQSLLSEMDQMIGKRKYLINSIYQFEGFQIEIVKLNKAQQPIAISIYSIAPIEGLWVAEKSSWRYLELPNNKKVLL